VSHSGEKIGIRSETKVSIVTLVKNRYGKGGQQGKRIGRPKVIERPDSKAICLYVRAANLGEISRRKAAIDWDRVCTLQKSSSTLN